MGRILALCGGVGGAKLAWGLAQVLSPDELTIVVNTGDDMEYVDLPVWPDIDTVLYTLAGLNDRKRGWGRAEETWGVMGELERLGGAHWFQLGDKDIALHLLRRELLSQGLSPSAVVRVLAQRLGVSHPILPMADTPVRTIVCTEEGNLPFQTYFVARRCVPRVTGLQFAGAEHAELPRELLQAFTDTALGGVILCPSNPLVSIGPMLAISRFRALLRDTSVPVIAVSPIVDGKAIKGPAAKMMRELQMGSSALDAVRCYQGLLDAAVLDLQDSALGGSRREGDPALYFRHTVMTTDEDRRQLAQACIDIIRALGSDGAVSG